MFPARPRYMLAFILMTVFASAAISQGTDSGQLKAHAETIRRATSLREASAAMGVLKSSGEEGLKLLVRLIDTEGVNPEVRYHLVLSAIRMQASGANDLALRFVASPDLDVRIAATRQLAWTAEPRHADALLAATRAEKHEGVQLMLLSALGRVGKNPKVKDFLEETLRPGGSKDLNHGAAFGLGVMAAGESSALKILSVVSDDVDRNYLEPLLDSAHGAMGRPTSENAALAHAKKGDPLRLLAVYQLGNTSDESLVNPADRRSPAVRSALADALRDPSAIIRHRAEIGFSYAWNARYTFLTDQEPLDLLAQMKTDKSAFVRNGLIEALHNTVLRRGLNIPGAMPIPLQPETMRMLRFPADWTTFPLLIDLLGDPDNTVATYACWMLGIGTGYWHGYASILLEGKAQVTPDVQSRYSAMWTQMKPKSPREVTVDIVEQTIHRLESGAAAEFQGQLMLGLKLLTGRSFGYKEDLDPKAKTLVVGQYREWWTQNKDKHPAQWIVDSAEATGLASVDEFNYYILARWGLGDLPQGLFDRKLRAEQPEEIVRRLVEWWQTVKQKS